MNFKQFFNENLYKSLDSTSEEIKFLWDEHNHDKNTSLGEPSKIPGNTEYQLVAKLDGEWRSCAGENTGGDFNRVAKSSKFFIGYRTYDPDTIRNKVMAAVKGSANLHRAIKRGEPFSSKQDDNLFGDRFVNKDIADTNKISRHLYAKDFYSLTEAEYQDLLNLALIKFLEVNKSKKYDIIAFPESRSFNVQDIAEKLANKVGTSNVTITTIEKIKVSSDNPKYVTNPDSTSAQYHLFDIDHIITTFKKFLPKTAQLTDSELREAINDYIKTFTGRHKNQTLSTATDLRNAGMKMETIFFHVLRFHGIPAAGITKLPGGRLNDFMLSHHDNQTFTDYLKQKHHTYDKNIAAQQALIGDRNVPETAKDKARMTLSRLNARDNILIIDDNINSGDLYKQILPTLTALPNKKVDFFFLLCRETYGTAGT